MSYQIYLDVCCLNRPFDDWTQSRIRIEAEAVLAIFEKCCSDNWMLISSTALDVEIARTLETARKQRVQDSLSLAEVKVAVTEEIMLRANELTHFGIKPFDAVHLACAETAGADIFLTTDDRLLRKATQHQSELTVRVANPVSWFMEVSAS